MDLGLQKKRALVCASSKGLGKAIAKSLADEGAHLFLCARSAGALLHTLSELQPHCSSSIHSHACDLSSRIDRQALVDEVLQVWNGLDILVHNVGGPRAASLMETTMEDWDRYYEQLFQSIIQLNQAFLPSMKDQGWGRIIIITSLSSFQPVPNLAISNAMRSAITAMAKTLADEVASYGITVNCIAPGTIHTDRTEERVADHIQRYGGTRESVLTEYAQEIPAKRLGRPEEFAAAATFLCAEQSAYITGSTLCVDGGKRRSYT